MSYNGQDRRKQDSEAVERLTFLEVKVEAVEKKLDTQSVLLQDLKETNLKVKTIVGAVTFVISGLWLVLSTFKETAIHWLTGR